MNQEKKSLKDSSIKELFEKSEGFRRELFSIGLNSTTAHVKDYSQFKKLRRNLARSLTYLRQKVQQEIMLQVKSVKKVESEEKIKIEKK